MEFARRKENLAKSFLTTLRKIASCFTVRSNIGVPYLAETAISFDTKDWQNKPDKLSMLLDENIYYNAFEELFKLDLSYEIKIVVIIDDLDRCFPEMAIKLLEIIKLIMAQPEFIFILGMSRKIIEGFLNKRMGKYGLQDFKGPQYLDKIIQLAFDIPPNRDKEKIKFFTIKLLSEIDKKYRIVLEKVVPIIGPICSNNFRTIIRFINNLLILKNVDDLVTISSEKETIPFELFTVSRILEQRWDNIYKLLLKSEEVCKEILNFDEDNFDNKCQMILEKKDDLTKKDIIEVIEALKADENLKYLLIESEIGKEWLGNEKVRKKTEDFFRSIKVIGSDDLLLNIVVWRAEYRDKEFGRKMYRFNANIEAKDDILDLIQDVIYFLHSSYDKPIQKITTRDNKFELRELAWGSSDLRVEVKIKDQEEAIKLTKRITLIDQPKPVYLGNKKTDQAPSMG